jgi:hypothetical protein
MPDRRWRTKSDAFAYAVLDPGRRAGLIRRGRRSHYQEHE